MTTTRDIAAAVDSRPGAAAVRPVHEHGWLVESRHLTSLGWVLYVRCAVCGARRVDEQPGGGGVPAPFSTVLF